MGAFRGKLLLAVFLLAFAVPSFGGSIDLDFGTGLAPAGGIVMISGTTVTGTNVPIGSLVISGDGMFDGVFPVTGDCGGFGCLMFDSSSGAVSIDGAVSALNSNLGTVMTLLTGMGTITATLKPSGVYQIDLSGSDTKNSTLLTDIGLPSNTGFLFSGTIFTGSNHTGNMYQAISTDIPNTMTPEPVSMLLMGTFLTLAGGLLSRKMRA